MTGIQSLDQVLDYGEELGFGDGRLIRKINGNLSLMLSKEDQKDYIREVSELILDYSHILYDAISNESKIDRKTNAKINKFRNYFVNVAQVVNSYAAFYGMLGLVKDLPKHEQLSRKKALYD